MKVILAALAALAAASPSTTTTTYTSFELKTKNNPRYNPENDWWKNAVFYQIYPRSFKDSNGDGIGDLQGIIDKLQHLKDAGVTATWLSPIFASPKKDQGYDIQDYRAIDSDYGSLDDLDRLIEEAHKLGIKIILDFVPNHTSDQHAWFKDSANGVDEFKDYYVWRDSKIPLFPFSPNNWQDITGGSAWTYNKVRKQHYLHQFSESQPDLNYRNPKVVEEMKDVLTFWLDHGVDGFRIDAVPMLFEDDRFLDEPSIVLDGKKILNHTYTVDQDETFDMIYQWRQLIDEYNEAKNGTRVIITEAYSPMDKILKYYGNENGTLGAHFSFNFNFITDLMQNFTVQDVVDSTMNWLSGIPKGYVSNWVLGNHDNHRIASRLGKENIDAFNMLASVLPGVQVTYYGEEIGMEDGEVTCDEGQDMADDCKTYNETSRDFERTPFQWDKTANAGFTNGSKGWLPVSDKYEDVNLRAQQTGDPKTHYNIYKKAVQIKSSWSEATEDTIYFVNVSSSNVLEVIRKVDSEEYVFLFNGGDKDVTIKPYNPNNHRYDVTVASVNSKKTIGQLMNKKGETLSPRESVIYQITSASVSIYQIGILSLIACYIIIILF